MRTVNESIMKAGPDLVYRVSAQIEHWPQFLPHYRWVTILRETEQGRLVEMASRRGPLPVKWRSLQRLDDGRREVHYQHVAGPTREMEVVWRIEPHEGGTRVVVVHELCLEVPMVRSLPGQWVV